MDWASKRAADEAACAVPVALCVPAPAREQRAADLRALACFHSVLAALEVAALTALRGCSVVVVRRRRCSRMGQFVRLWGGGAVAAGRDLRDVAVQHLEPLSGP